MPCGVTSKEKKRKKVKVKKTRANRSCSAEHKPSVWYTVQTTVNIGGLASVLEQGQHHACRDLQGLR